MKRFAILLCSLFLAISMPACGDHDHDDHSGHDHHGHDHDGHNHDPNEVMTTLNLTFTPEGDGDPVTATWADPEQDGMPKIDTITLEEGKTYTLTIEVLNELEKPPEDVTKELRDELDEHQFFFTGESVASPASTSTAAIISQEYADKDASGFPVGLSSTIKAEAAGMGDLTIMLRHMPPVNNTAVKTGDLAELVKDGKTAELPGNIDIEVVFPVTVE